MRSQWCCACESKRTTSFKPSWISWTLRTSNYCCNSSLRHCRKRIRSLYKFSKWPRQPCIPPATFYLLRTRVRARSVLKIYWQIKSQASPRVAHIWSLQDAIPRSKRRRRWAAYLAHCREFYGTRKRPDPIERQNNRPWRCSQSNSRFDLQFRSLNS